MNFAVVRPIKSNGGFTLIELLVVLVVLGLLTVMLAGGLHTAATALQRVTVRDADSEELDMARNLLRSLFSQSYPGLAGDASHRIVRFNGEASQVAFLAPLAQRFGAEDIVAYRLQFAPDGTLQLTWHLDRDDTDPAVAGALPVVGVTSVVLSNVTDGTILYYGAGSGAEAHWSNNWVGQRVFPQLVRVRFTWKNLHADLVVAPLLTASSCVSGPLEVSPCPS